MGLKYISGAQVVGTCIGYEVHLEIETERVGESGYSRRSYVMSLLLPKRRVRSGDGPSVYCWLRFYSNTELM